MTYFSNDRFRQKRNHNTCASESFDLTVLIDLMMTAHDEADSSPLVFEKVQVNKRQRKTSRRLQIHEGFLFLSVSQLVGIFIVAFVVGALSPLVIFKARGEKHGNKLPAHTLEPTDSKIWNNLRHSAQAYHNNKTIIGNSAHSGPKLAWRK